MESMEYEDCHGSQSRDFGGPVDTPEIRLAAASVRSEAAGHFLAWLQVGSAAHSTEGARWTEHDPTTG